MQLTPTYNVIRNVYKLRKSTRTVDEVINHIYNVVEKETGITKFQLKSGSRKREVANANKIAAYLMYYYTPFGTKKVGLELGGFDHSTIITRIQTLFDLMTWDKVYSEQFRRCELSVSSMQKKFIKKTILVYDLNMILVNEFKSNKAAADHFNVGVSAVINCLKGRSKTCCNHIFKYK